MGSLRLRAVTFVALALVCSLGVVSAAFAAPPVISSVTPADGARFTGGFTVSFSATDPNALDGANASVVVGGNTYRPAVSYGGYWDGDGCDTWWVEDQTSASFTCAIPDPGPGIHTVTIRVPDRAGEAATQSLTVTRTAAITFSQASPAPGGRYASADDLFLLLTGPTISTSSATVAVDGVTVPAVCESFGAGKAVVRADRAFAAGSHTVTVSVGDGTSAPPAITTWTFSVSSTAKPPTVGAPQPAEGATVQGPFQLAFHVSDANTVNGATARVSVLGQVYAGAVTYAGYWADDGCETWWAEDRTQADVVFAIPDLPPGSHTLRFEVADGAGDWVVKKTSVLRSAALTAIGHAPAASSRNAAVETVSVSLTGGTVEPASVSMTIDGALVAATFTPSADGGIVSYSAPIPEGSHAVSVSASDILGSPPMTTQWSFVVDATAPRVVSVSPAADSTMTAADAGMAIRLDDADAIAPESVALTLDGASAPVQVTPDATGAWVRWSGVLAEGAHSATVVARDLGGNEVEYSWTFFVADPPRIGAVAPTGAPVDGNTVLTADVSDVNAEIDPAVVVTLDGATVPATFVPTGVRRGRVEAPVAGLADGSHTAVVSVRDASGNAASKTWTFAVDAAGPVLQSRAPSPGAVLGNHTVSVSGQFVDASSIDPATAAATLDGAPIAINAWNETRWVGEGCDAYEEVIPESLLLAGSYALHDGPHTLRLAATDAFGQQTAEEWSFTVREFPKISAVTPAVGTHTQQSSVTLRANVGDFDGIASTGISWRHAGEGEEAWQPLSSAYDAQSGVLSAEFTFPSGEAGYEFRFTAEDTGGLATTAVTGVYADTAGPVIDLSSLAPAPSATVTNHAVTFRGRFTDSSTMDAASTRAYVDGQAVAVSSAHETQWVGEGCDAYEEELPATLAFSGTVQLHDGQHTVRVQAADVFGYTTTHEWTFTVAEAPKIASVTPVAGGRMTATHVLASAKVTDFDGIASAAIAWREANTGRPAGEWQTLPTTYDAATGLLAGDFAFPANDTRYEIRVSATDSGGLATTAVTSIFAASSANHIQAGTDCQTCHTAILQTHEIVNCYACHSNAGGPCDCHGVGVHPREYLTGVALYDHNGDYIGRTCTDCHSHVADVEAQRHSSGLAAGCVGCHEQSLTAEHEGMVVDGQPFTCSTCHQSSDSTVTAAIAAGDPSCTACHPAYHADFATRHTAPTATCQGGGCHASTSLVDTHAEYVGAGNRYPQYGDTCELCHMNEDPTRIPATASPDCATCHPDRVEPHGYEPEMHAATPGSGFVLLFDSNHDDPTQGPLGATVACTICHNTDLGAVHANRCSTCHPAPVDSLPDWNTSCSQAGCHTTYHAESGKAHYDVLEGNCVGACHDESYVLYDQPCVKCHAVPDGSDGTAPVTTSDARSAYEGTARVTFTVADGGKVPLATTFYRLDGAAARTGSSVDVSANGAHTLEYWSVDQFGNAETPHKTASFTVTADTTPPTTTSNAQASYGGPAVITLTASDTSFLGVKATRYRLNGGATATGTSVSVPQPSSGTLTCTLEFWSEDHAGNVESPKSVTFTVSPDVTPPVSTIVVQPYYTKSGYVFIPFTAEDAGSGVKAKYYRVNGGGVSSVSPSNTGFWRSFTEGPHVIEYWSVDNSGNVEQHRTVNLIADWTWPSVVSDVQPTYPSSGATITITGWDLPTNGSGLVGVRYRLDGGPEVSGPASTQVTVTAQGNHVIEYWAIDGAGNTSEHVTRSFTVGTVSGPTGTISLRWAAPPGSRAEYRIWDSSGTLVVHVLSSEIPNWTGSYTATVPVRSQSYDWQVDWFDADSGEEGATTGIALIDYAGKAYETWY